MQLDRQRPLDATSRLAALSSASRMRAPRVLLVQPRLYSRSDSPGLRFDVIAEHRGAGALLRANARRASNQKRLPRPGSLRRGVAAAINCARWRVIARPSPVPPKRRVVVLSACSEAGEQLGDLARLDADAGVSRP